DPNDGLSITRPEDVVPLAICVAIALRRLTISGLVSFRPMYLAYTSALTVSPGITLKDRPRPYISLVPPLRRWAYPGVVVGDIPLLRSRRYDWTFRALPYRTKVAYSSSEFSGSSVPVPNSVSDFVVNVNRTLPRWSFR